MAKVAASMKEEDEKLEGWRLSEAEAVGVYFS